MKKWKKGIITASILLPVVLGTAYGTYRIINNIQQQEKPDNNDIDKTLPIENRIDKDDSKQAQDDFNEIKDDFPNPDDIIIPDDATEEEKEQMGVAKQYLTIFSSVNSLFKKTLQKSGENVENFAINEISDVYRASGAYVFNLDVLKCSNGKYFHSNILFKVYSKETSTIEDLFQEANNFTNGQIEYEFDSYLSNREMNSKLFNDKCPIDSYSVVLDVVLFTSGDMTETPIESNVLVTDGKEFCVMNLYYWGHSIGKTYEEMQKEIQSQQSYARIKMLDSYTMSSFNWKEFLQEYKDYRQEQSKQEALELEQAGKATAQSEALAASFETTNEQGEVDGFDWNAYQEYMKQKEAEKEDESIADQSKQQTTSLYSEKELGF
ncbi:MAG: hypothetical protein ACI4T2_03010 [Christensenellales bacterium]